MVKQTQRSNTKRSFGICVLAAVLSAGCTDNGATATKTTVSSTQVSLTSLRFRKAAATELAKDIPFPRDTAFGYVPQTGLADVKPTEWLEIARITDSKFSVTYFAMCRYPSAVRVRTDGGKTTVTLQTGSDSQGNTCPGGGAIATAVVEGNFPSDVAEIVDSADGLAASKV